MTPDQLDQASEQSARMQDFVAHTFLFIGVMIALTIIAFIARSWDWFLAAFAGWALVLFGQALYVFVLNRAHMSEDTEDIAVRQAAVDMKSIS